jgi:alpha-ketoglutarate-dependent taurine dioxygenase
MVEKRVICCCRVVQLHRSSKTRVGLAAQTERAASKTLISQIARIDLQYSIKWPLNVVVSEENLQIYQAALPVLLQVFLMIL